MSRRPALIAAIGAAGLLLFCGLPIAAVISQEPDAHAACAAPGASAPVALPTTGPGPVGKWNAEEVNNAAIIVSVGAEMQVPPRGWIIAVATAMTESHLRNLGYLGDANDHDSLGLFQQRPSQGWGTPEQIMDPRYASRKFYEKLLTVKDWATIPLTEAAQAVQRSGFPDRYANFEEDAQKVVVAVARVKSISDLPGASLVSCSDPGPISSSGWTQPVKAKVGSGFRTPDRPDHQGVDLIAPRNTVIRAASGGRVVFADCDNDTGNCNIDGSPQTPGCGWFVEILHASGVATRYCHMVQKPAVSYGQTVKAGDEIGLVGTSGHSSGTHLHYEVHKNVSCGQTRCSLTRNNATDPVTFMREVGAPLGEAS